MGSGLGENIKLRKYECENCGHEMFPEEEIDECRICGESVTEVQHEVEKSEFVRLIKEKSNEMEEEGGKSVFGLLKEDELIIKSGEKDGGVVERYENVERVHVYSEGSLGVAIECPDYADFPCLQDAEKKGSRVDITLKKVGN